MKQFNVSFYCLPILLLIVTGCQKQIDSMDKNGPAPTVNAGNHANLENRCRLLVDKGLSDGFLQWYHYNGNGLADEVHYFKPAVIDFSASMEYNSRQQMTSAKIYFGSDYYADIVFDYDKDKIIKETWYQAGTLNQIDGYINIYDAQGRLVKRDEPDFGLYALFNYDGKGNPVNIEVYDYQDNLYYGSDFEYTTSLKNPFLTATGIPESIFFTDYMEGPNRFTGLRQYFKDENGDQVAFFHWKAGETEILAGDQNLPLYQNSRDDVSGDWTDQTWTYENCAGNSEPASYNRSHKPSKGNPFKQLIMAKKTNHYKQDLLNFKIQFLTSHQ